MPPRSLDAQASSHFTFRALTECGDTYDLLVEEGGVDVTPQHPKTWTALEGLATNLLEPLVEAFGRPCITYGFSPPALYRHIEHRICPELDQHAAHELNEAGEAACKRGGAAVDVHYPGLSSAHVVAFLIGAFYPVDRLYYYGPDRPVHIAWHPEPEHSFIRMVNGKRGRMPRGHVTIAQLYQDSTWRPGRC